VTYAVLLAQMPHPTRLALALSVAYVGYYMGASVYLTLRHRHRPGRDDSGTEGVVEMPKLSPVAGSGD